MNTLKSFAAAAALAAPLIGQAQATDRTAGGTLADYRRAYAARQQFSNSKVLQWPRDVRWVDSTDAFHYTMETADGRRYVLGHAADGTTQTFDREEAWREAIARLRPGSGARRDRPRAGRDEGPGRKRRRHWMEVDEERDLRVVPSPDNRWEAYVQDHNVVLHEKGKPYTQCRQLTTDGTIGEYYSNRLSFSPDGRYLLACRRVPVEKRYVYYVESSPADQLQPYLHKQEYAKPGDKLPQRYPVIIDLQTGKRVEADRTQIDNQYDLGNFAWLPNSAEVTMSYNRRGHQLYRVLAMSAATGALRTVVEERAGTFVNYSRLYRHDLADGERMLWMSERDNWNHLYLVNIRKGRVERQLTRGAWCVREVVSVDEPNGRIVFTASGMNRGEDPYNVHYYAIGLDGRNLVCLTPGEGHHRAVFSPGRRYLVDTYSMPDRAPVTELRSAADGRLIRRLAEADISRLTAQGWRAPERFVAKGRDGKTDMYGLIYRPSNFDPSSSYPIIEYIYAGPGSAYVPKEFNAYSWWATSLAELGFIVVQVDGMGTSWRGKAFEEVCYKNLKDAGLPDHMAWIKAACARYAYMDSTRVGIFGCSAGGQESTTAVLLHGDFYKAAYSACGCHDNRMDKIWWNEQWMGWPVDSSYVACSNVANAHLLKRPLMLLVGELDDNVDPASTMQVANALVKANKDFELVVIPGAHHTMGEDYGEHKRYDFFVRHLMGKTPPAWDDVPNP